MSRRPGRSPSIPGEYTFEVAGAYEYVCEPHEGSGMSGTIDVE